MESFCELAGSYHPLFIRNEPITLSTSTQTKSEFLTSELDQKKYVNPKKQITIFQPVNLY